MQPTPYSPSGPHIAPMCGPKGGATHGLCPPSLLCTTKGVFTTKPGFLTTGAKAPTVWHTNFKLNPQAGTQHMGISSLDTQVLGKSCLLVGEGAQKLGRKPLLSRRVPGFVPANIMSALRNKQQTNTSRCPGTGIGAGCVLVVKHWAGALASVYLVSLTCHNKKAPAGWKTLARTPNLACTWLCQQAFGLAWEQYSGVLLVTSIKPLNL
jgi:hypothetical protein